MRRERGPEGPLYPWKFRLLLASRDCGVGRGILQSVCYRRCLDGGFGLLEIFEQTVMHAVEREFEAIADSEFVVHLAKIILNDLFGGADFCGDIFVAQALRNS